MMRLDIHIFAKLAETLGTNVVMLECERDELTVEQLKQLLVERYPQAEQLILQCFIAKNQAYARPHEMVSEADELAAIPPVSGGGGSAAVEREPLYVVTTDTLDINEVTRKVLHPDHGATIAFVGTTREHTQGKRTVTLEYEGYVPMAVRTLEQIGDEIAERCAGALCAITHRIGSVPAGEASVVIAVSAPHRGACYDASRYAIERLKQIVPIWKKEMWEDGSEWVGPQSGSWDPTGSPGDPSGSGHSAEIDASAVADTDQATDFGILKDTGGETDADVITSARSVDTGLKGDTAVDPRYSRHVLFAPIGEQGQRRLNDSRVAIVGLGALGSVLANHMVRAGVGYVRLIDRDFVEMSNLQRQMLYEEEDAANSTPKALAAANRLKRINSLVELDAHVVDLNATNAERLLNNIDLILDGTDNFSVRFLINDVSVKHRIPWIYGGAVSSRGVVLPIVPYTTPCLRCMFPHPPAQGTAETCDTAGVIGPIVHVVASIQAAEALKLLTGDTAHVNRRMLHFDLWHNHQSGIDMSNARKTDCPTCETGSYDYLNAVASEGTIQSLCGRDSVQVVPDRPGVFDLQQWSCKFAAIGHTELNPFLLKFQIDDRLVLVLFPDGRVIIQGTDDIVLAKSLYSKYIGM